MPATTTHERVLPGRSLSTGPSEASPLQHVGHFLFRFFVILSRNVFFFGFALGREELLPLPHRAPAPPPRSAPSVAGPGGAERRAPARARRPASRTAPARVRRPGPGRRLYMTQLYMTQLYVTQLYMTQLYMTQSVLDTVKKVGWTW